MLPWLREIDGFNGLLMLSDEHHGRTLVVTFWESRELADAHLAARAEFRDRFTSTVDVRVEDVSDYELMFADLGSRGARVTPLVPDGGDPYGRGNRQAEPVECARRIPSDDGEPAAWGDQQSLLARRDVL